MPMIVELTPGQQAIFAEIAEELQRNGFEAEPFGIRTIAIQRAPPRESALTIGACSQELLEQFEREEQALNLEKIRTRHCGLHCLSCGDQGEYAAGQAKMEWLLAELGKNEVSDELSPWQTRRAAVFCKGHPEGV